MHVNVHVHEMRPGFAFCVDVVVDVHVDVDLDVDVLVDVIGFLIFS